MVCKTLNKTTRLRLKHGFTLIELLVAMVIGLIIIGGAMQIYLANKQVYRSQVASSYVSSNARFALHLMQNTVNHAGYKGDPSEADESAFPAGSIAGCSAFTKGQVIADASGVGGLFCVRMKTASNSLGAATDIAQMTDCIGNAIQEDDVVTTRFFISASNELSCQTDHANSAGLSQPLVNDMAITKADLLFGEDTKNNDVVELPYIPTPSDWRKVLAVNVTMKLKSNSYAMGKSVTTDGELLEKELSRTFAFRNRTNPQP